MERIRNVKKTKMRKTYIAGGILIILFLIPSLIGYIKGFHEVVDTVDHRKVFENKSDSFPLNSKNDFVSPKSTATGEDKSPTPLNQNEGEKKARYDQAGLVNRLNEEFPKIGIEGDHGQEIANRLEKSLGKSNPNLIDEIAADITKEERLPLDRIDSVKKVIIAAISQQAPMVNVAEWSACLNERFDTVLELNNVDTNCVKPYFDKFMGQYVYSQTEQEIAQEDLSKLGSRTAEFEIPVIKKCKLKPTLAMAVFKLDCNAAYDVPKLKEIGR